MAHATFVARAADGMILAGRQSDAQSLPSDVKWQARQILVELRTMSTQCSIDGLGNFVAHLIIDSGVCYLALFDGKYPRNFAFAYLEEIKDLFQDELKREFGTGSVDYRSQIETVERPYHFVKFDQSIKKKEVDYWNPSSSKAVIALHANLVQVSSITRHSIDEILIRGNCIGTFAEKTSLLDEASKPFMGMANLVAFRTLVERYYLHASMVTLFVVAMFVITDFVRNHIGIRTVSFMFLLGCCVMSLRNGNTYRPAVTALKYSLVFVPGAAAFSMDGDSADSII